MNELIKDTRTEILAIEKAIGECSNSVHGDVFPLFHSFSDGIYVREIQIPAGQLLTGKIHRHEHPNFLLRGKVTVITESGGQEVLEAPCYMISAAGTKRAVYTHEDCSWVTVHTNPTNETDINKLEEMIIAPDFNDEQLTENKVKVLEEI